MNNLINHPLDSSTGKKQVPVWFMRQAGRYHSHYQSIRKKSDFMTMCKTPELACEITMGPIRDFDFSAAILFSDLLFPLEFLGMGLDYLQGPPRLGFHLEKESDLNRLNPIADEESFFDFQKQALKLLSKELPKDKTLIGFAGAPFTLFTYAVEGSHKGNLVNTKKFLYQGVYEKFYQKLKKSLIKNLLIQAQGGAQALCLFDTAAGELCSFDFKNFLIPHLNEIFTEFKSHYPKVSLTYYSKMTSPQWLVGEGLACDILAFDWRTDLVKASESLSSYTLQGNIDPAWLHLEKNHLKRNLEELKRHLDQNNFDYSKWIFGLGHGVLIETPEDNVRFCVEWVKKNLQY